MSERRPAGYWTPEKINRAYNELKEELGRVPMKREFPSGALSAITRGRYDENVRNWNQYLEYRREELNKKRGYWTLDRIDAAFDQLKEELGRIPTYDEFPRRALEIIEKGKYDSKIRMWNQYLIHRGEELNHEYRKWIPDEVDRVFDEMREELGRVPTVDEFREKYSGAINAIVNKRYNPNIMNWGGYLEGRGEEPYRDRSKSKRGINLLENLLEDEGGEDE